MIDIINAIVLLLNYIFIPAITYGSQLALGALGITFIYGILRFANFSHGEFMSFGTMSCILVTWFLQSNNINLGYLTHSSFSLTICNSFNNSTVIIV